MSVTADPRTFTGPARARANRWSRAGGCLLLALIAGCTSSTEGRLLRLLPDLPCPLARGLAVGDDARVREEVRKLGPEATLRLLQRMKHAVPIGDSAEYAASKRWLDAPLVRLSGQLSRSFAFDGEEAEIRAFVARPYRTARRLRAISDSVQALMEDSRSSPSAKLPHLNRWLAEIETLDVVIEPPSFVDCVAQIRDELGDASGELEAYRRALALSRRRGTLVFTLRLMNTLGYVYRKSGQIDSMLALHHRALHESRARGLASEAGRAQRMLGLYEHSRGRLAAAHDLLLEARDAVIRRKTGLSDLWEYVRLVELHALFGEWELVRRELDQAEIALRALPPEVHTEVGNTPARLRGLRVRLLIAQGEVDSALARMPALRDTIRRSGSRESMALLLLNVGSGLLERSRCAEAADLLAEGLSEATVRRLPALGPELSATLADALVCVGRLDDADRALRRFEVLASGDDIEEREAWLVRDRALIRLRLARGEAAGALDAAAIATARLERFVRRLEPSAEAYFFLDESRRLTAVVHDALGQDARARYGFEMWTRSLPRRLGDSEGDTPVRLGPNHAGSGRQFRDRLRASARDLELRLRRARWSHVLYRVEPDCILRWTCGADGVRLDRLAIEERDLTPEVGRARALLRSGRAAGSPRTLERLARALLPTEMLPGGRVPPWRRVLITRDRALHALPFDGLDLDASPAYRPVADAAETAYLRFDSGRTSRRSPPRALVIADPALPENVLRLYPMLGSIPMSESEAKAVARGFPDVTLLTGSRATKTNVIQNWTAATTIHVAAHFVRDSELPYLAFLPLAEGSGPANRDARFLDIADVCRVSFDRCNLVVLSGCETGAASDNSESPGPSFGDVFLDSGSEVVIDTAWPVPDQQAFDLMRSFADAGSAGAPAWSALRAAKQRALRSGLAGAAGGAWAAYSITCGLLPLDSARVEARAPVSIALEARGRRFLEPPRDHDRPARSRPACRLPWRPSTSPNRPPALW